MGKRWPAWLTVLLVVSLCVGASTIGAVLAGNPRYVFKPSLWPSTLRSDEVKLEDAVRDYYGGRIDGFTVDAAVVSNRDWFTSGKPKVVYEGSYTVVGAAAPFTFRIVGVTAKDIINDPQLDTGQNSVPANTVFNHMDVGGVDRYIILAAAVSMDLGAQSFSYAVGDEISAELTYGATSSPDTRPSERFGAYGMQPVAGSVSMQLVDSADRQDVVSILSGGRYVAVYVWDAQSSRWVLVYR